jgi:small-conductance mechanosensitive channel
MVELFGYDLDTEIMYGITAMDIIVFLLVLLIGYIVVRLVSGSIKKRLLKMKAGELLADFTCRILRIVLYIFVVGIALTFLGINVGAALIAVSVVLGFVLGFALGDTLGNFAAGFMIAITKPFKKGDYVEVAGQDGTIMSVGISITELKTPDNKHVIIPNRAVWSSPVINYTRFDIRRIDLTVGVGYGDDLEHVIKTTMDIVSSNPKIATKPEPQIEVVEMAASSVDLVVRPWVRTEDYWDVYFELQKALKTGYDKAGISIPYPQTDVHIVEGQQPK